MSCPDRTLPRFLCQNCPISQKTLTFFSLIARTSVGKSGSHLQAINKSSFLLRHCPLPVTVVFTQATDPSYLDSPPPNCLCFCPVLHAVPSLTISFAFICVHICMCPCECVLTTRQAWRLEDNPLLPGIELRPSVLVARAFTH